MKGEGKARTLEAIRFRLPHYDVVADIVFIVVPNLSSPPLPSFELLPLPDTR